MFNIEKARTYYCTNCGELYHEEDLKDYTCPHHPTTSLVIIPKRMSFTSYFTTSETQRNFFYELTNIIFEYPANTSIEKIIEDVKENTLREVDDKKIISNRIELALKNNIYVFMRNLTLYLGLEFSTKHELNCSQLVRFLEKCDFLGCTLGDHLDITISDLEDIIEIFYKTTIRR